MGARGGERTSNDFCPPLPLPGLPNLVTYIHNRDYDKDAQTMTVASTAGQCAAGPWSCSHTPNSGCAFPAPTLVHSFPTCHCDFEERDKAIKAEKKEGGERGGKDQVEAKMRV